MSRLLIALLVSFGLLACTDPCVKLGERVCDCRETTSEVDDCKSAVNNNATRIELTGADEDQCSALLDRCEALIDAQGCSALDTPEGQQTCGLAREPSAQ